MRSAILATGLLTVLALTGEAADFKATKKSCDKGLAATEQAFFIALRTSAVWDMVGSQLVLKSPNGELKFDRAL